MAQHESFAERTILAAAEAVERAVDEKISALEDVGDEDLERIRKERMVAMKKRKEDEKKWERKGHGEVEDLPDEKAFFDALKGEERFVCHFYRENRPCKVVDMHLKVLATKHVETKFARIDAEKSPFLTQRLNIWMLPTISIVKNDKATDYIVGLDELGGSEDFPTETLEERLLAVEAILDVSGPRRPSQFNKDVPTRTIRQGRRIEAVGSEDESSDFST